MDAIKEFNWVDVLIIALLFRVLYVAVKKGFVVELFKLLGTLVALYLSLHYYIQLSDLLVNSPGVQNMPVEFVNFISFSFLAAIGYVLFMLLRQTVCHLLKVEALTQLDRWGGLLLGVGRGFLLVVLISYLLLISSIGYLGRSVYKSYFGSRFLKAAPAVYSFIWNGIMSKFMGSEKLNQAVQETIDKEAIK